MPGLVKQDKINTYLWTMVTRTSINVSRADWIINKFFVFCFLFITLIPAGYFTLVDRDGAVTEGGLLLAHEFTSGQVLLFRV